MFKIKCLWHNHGTSLPSDWLPWLFSWRFPYKEVSNTFIHWFACEIKIFSWFSVQYSFSFLTMSISYLSSTPQVFSLSALTWFIWITHNYKEDSNAWTHSSFSSFIPKLASMYLSRSPLSFIMIPIVQSQFPHLHSWYSSYCSGD